MPFDILKTREILNKIPTVLMLGTVTNFTTVTGNQIYKIEHYGICLGRKKDESYLTIPASETARFLDGLILQAMNLGYVYDNENNPLKNLLTSNVLSQIELSKLQGIEPQEKKSSVIKAIL